MTVRRLFAAFIWNILVMLSAILTIELSAQAQTFAVIHTLNGGSDGNQPISGLTVDRAGNLYGTAYEGGINNCPDGYGCGTVFKLSRHGTEWIFAVLYRFTGITDGWAPAAPVTVAPDGSIYGTTALGGGNGCGGIGCGTVFRLQPPPTICPTVSCPWTKTTLHQFTFGADGAYPEGALILDHAGNIYGTATNSEDQNARGTAWELSPSAGGWLFNVIHEFTAADGAGWPTGGLIFDRNGNLWGGGGFGGLQNCADPQLPNYCGSIFELTPSGSGWRENTAFGFTASTGGNPTGTLALDSSGNVYGTLDENGERGNGGVFEFTPPNGPLSVLFAGSGTNGNSFGPTGGVIIDRFGDVYAADPYTGANNFGFVFELKPLNGSWTLTDLHDFTGGNDGVYPYGPLVLDSNGNIYGANYSNVIFEISP